MDDVIRAEWQKLRTARTTRIVLGSMAVLSLLTLGIAWYFVATWDGLSPDMRAHSSLGSLPDLVGWVASLIMAVFGTLTITSEFSSGMIRTTFTAMPQRSRVVAAKAIVVALTGFATSASALTVTLVGAALIVGERPVVGQGPLHVEAVLIVLAMALSTAMFALIGLGLGAVTRSGLASVVILSLLWYVVPMVASHAAAPWGTALSSLVPGALAGELAGTGNANSVFGGALSPVGASIAMLVYALAPVVGGAISIARRDA